MRQSTRFLLTDPMQFKSQLLLWAAQFDSCAYLNSNSFHTNKDDNKNYASFDLIVAVGSIQDFKSRPGYAFDSLDAFIKKKQDWLFGYFGYDLKNETENLVSENEDGLNFEEIHFFQPKYVFKIQGNLLYIEYLIEFSSEAEIMLLFDKIIALQVESSANSILSETKIQAKVSKEHYLFSIQEIKKHIQKGDVYELNYCVEFFANHVSIIPEITYQELNAISQTPFSCMYRNGHHYILCASPERFLKKEGNKLISQPIKGTQKRGKNEAEDEALKLLLFNDAKERSENVMIVDLVRNDLSKTAERGSVKVEELFGVYTFKQVHQLISTVTSTLNSEYSEVHAIKSAFPMGSMTGAPKIRAMQLIEQFENTKRGAYSGAVGYFSPDGNFDFNVVIRSILYNAKNKYLSFMVGSAITSNSVAEKEYAECLLKAEAMFAVLDKNNTIGTS
jgi:para-aminobenzoate synthetase component 1